MKAINKNLIICVLASTVFLTATIPIVAHATEPSTEYSITEQSTESSVEQPTEPSTEPSTDMPFVQPTSDTDTLIQNYLTIFLMLFWYGSGLATLLSFIGYGVFKAISLININHIH